MLLNPTTLVVDFNLADRSIASDVKMIINSTKFQTDKIFQDSRVIDWLNRFRLNVDEIINIRVAGAIERRPGVLHSVFLEVWFVYKGRSLQRSILIRGPAVVVIVLLRCTTFQTSQFLVVRQPRIATGEESYEFPSGNHDKSTPLDSAVQELQEETGLLISRQRFVCLRKATIVCESALDELADWFLVELDQEEGLIGEFGAVSEGEYTRTELITWDTLLAINSFHMIAARTLIQEFYNRS